MSHVCKLSHFGSGENTESVGEKRICDCGNFSAIKNIYSGITFQKLEYVGRKKYFGERKADQ